MPQDSPHSQPSNTGKMVLIYAALFFGGLGVAVALSKLGKTAGDEQPSKRDKTAARNEADVPPEPARPDVPSDAPAKPDATPQDPILAQAQSSEPGVMLRFAQRYADDHPDAIGKKLGISVSNAGDPASTAAFDHASLTYTSDGN